jgi:hypothetical protein
MDGLALCAPVACGLWPVACGAWRLCLLVAEWLWLWIAAIADVTAACCYCCCYWPESGCAVLLLLLLLLLLLADDLLLAPVLHETPPCTCTPHVHRARAAARRYGAGCWQLLGALCLSPPPPPRPPWPGLALTFYPPRPPLLSLLRSRLSSLFHRPPAASRRLPPLPRSRYCQCTAGGCGGAGAAGAELGAAGSWALALGELGEGEQQLGAGGKPALCRSDSWQWLWRVSATVLGAGAVSCVSSASASCCRLPTAGL